MKELTTSIKTIDSREVAEMLGKEHKYVLRDIEGTGKVIGIIPTLLSASLHPDKYFIESNYIDKSGKRNKCYLVTKMGCELLGNKQQGEKGILFTAKYVERFNQMEQQFKLPTTYKEALLKLVEAEEEKERMLLAIEEKTKLINQIESANNSILVRDVAKIASKNGIIIGERKLYQKLRDWKLLMKGNIPYQEYIDRGYFEIIERAVETSNKTLLSKTTMVTGKGQTYIIKRLLKEK